VEIINFQFSNADREFSRTVALRFEGIDLADEAACTLKGGWLSELPHGEDCWIGFLTENCAYLAQWHLFWQRADRDLALPTIALAPKHQSNQFIRLVGAVGFEPTTR
jgi:hypothetical protein